MIPDIGEFLIQVALSQKYQFEQIRTYIYEEYFARQIYWIQKDGRVPDLLKIQTKDLFAVFEASKVSNHLLVFNLQMAQTFIVPDVKECVVFHTNLFISNVLSISDVWIDVMVIHPMRSLKISNSS